MGGLRNGKGPRRRRFRITQTSPECGVEPFRGAEYEVRDPFRRLPRFHRWLLGPDER